MKNIRVIPRLDIKGPNVIKGIHLEGLRVVGKPGELAQKYYDQGADEILYMDVVASLYQRNHLAEIVREASSHIFIPLTVGGGIRTPSDIDNLLRSGADKVSINTAAVKNPQFIYEASRLFGSQCIVVSIEAKKIENGKWEVYTDNGREPSGLNVMEWVKRAEELGAGEILITSVDCEGTQKGYELDLIQQVTSKVQIPVMAHGGAGQLDHFREVLTKSHPDALCLSSMLHYEKCSVGEIKKTLHKAFYQDGTASDVERVMIA